MPVAAAAPQQADSLLHCNIFPSRATNCRVDSAFCREIVSAFGGGAVVDCWGVQPADEWVDGDEQIDILSEARAAQHILNDAGVGKARGEIEIATSMKSFAWPHPTGFTRSGKPLRPRHRSSGRSHPPLRTPLSMCYR